MVEAPGPPSVTKALELQHLGGVAQAPRSGALGGEGLNRCRAGELVTRNTAARDDDFVNLSRLCFLLLSFGLGSGLGGGLARNDHKCQDATDQ